MRRSILFKSGLQKAPPNPLLDEEGKTGRRSGVRLGRQKAPLFAAVGAVSGAMHAEDQAASALYSPFELQKRRLPLRAACGFGPT
mmetsp:Transcript_13554/g.31151  ORF Transcript_13554/g.31151 Transcript_13554/m.31151 type:complete len:85 (-) Transcript_13554:7-261(-)